MERLNYCRQATLTLRHSEITHPLEYVRQECTTALNTMHKAEKFLLPDGGRLLPDAELRGLDGLDRLSLPFQTVALEYGLSAAKQKRITLATEREDDIALQHIFGDGMSWTPTCTILMPRNVPFLLDYGPHKGLPDVSPIDAECPFEIAVEPAVALLSMLNALACSNVRIERCEPKRFGKKIKAALPFDTYHILTIDAPRSGGTGAATGGHRAPREHLRRGHIRRLADGRRIWVNATVVAALRGAGVVTKDYALRCAA